jgi:NodT family efflux transporter outer membrane factor (OMF) lipoprotein
MLAPIKPLRGRAALVLLALSTTACASIPNLGAMPEARSAPALQSVETLAAEGAEWPGAGWWRSYNDPQLAQLIDEALGGSPDLDIAAARIRVAEAMAQQAGAALLPSIDAGASVSAVKLSKNNGVPAQLVPGGWNDTASVRLGLSFDLDLWGKNKAALHAAKLDLTAARYDADQARLSLTTAVASTYAELAALYAQRDILSSALEIRNETLRLVGQRTAQGLDTRATLRQAEGRAEQAEANLATTDEAIALANNALAALVGAGPDRGKFIGRPQIAALRPQGVPDNAAIALVGRRPDIAAARARADASAQQIKVARAEFYPNVNLSALAGLQAFGLGNLFQQNSQFGSAGPAVTLPLFHGGALQGQYRARRGQYDEAIATYDRQVIEALRETADALTSKTMLAARLESSRRALADFEEANRLARLRYANGLSTYLEVLSAEEGVLDSRLAVAKLETRAFALDVNLIRALGGGFKA